MRSDEELDFLVEEFFIDGGECVQVNVKEISKEVESFFDD